MAKTDKTQTIAPLTETSGAANADPEFREAQLATEKSKRRPPVVKEDERLRLSDAVEGVPEFSD